MSSIRATIRQLLKPLQRVRPRTPFWNIPAHRIPTLRLYRNLLRQAPTYAICFRIRMLWKENKSLTGIEQTRNALRQSYKYLDIFQRANAGNQHLHNVLMRYSRLIDIHCEKAYWAYLLTKNLVWQAKLRYRPILTGAYFPPSFYNKPLPRMIHQPVKLSQMIRWRYDAHHRRTERSQAYLSALADLKIDCRAEEMFNKNLEPSSSHLFSGHYEDWARPYKEGLKSLEEAFSRSRERAKTPFSQDLIDQIKRARTERIRNKTNERIREIRGEIPRSLLRKLRKGPPAHILCQMSARQRFLDKLARHPSEVGLTAAAKRQIKRGRFKNPNAWIVEESRENKAELDVIASSIRQQNILKRTTTRHRQ